VNQTNDSAQFPPGWNEILETAVHDIRNPLSSMLATLEILRHVTEGSEPAAKAIELLDRQVMKVSEQLERLLQDPESFRRAEGGSAE
jgi:signal transduction histidine kinase